MDKSKSNIYMDQSKSNTYMEYLYNLEELYWKDKSREVWLMNGLVEGIKVCKNAPVMTHLLFADDSLLFYKATIKDFQTIKEYLQKYCLASGQENNFDKSGILFSKKIPKHLKQQLSNILDISNRDFGEKYLGTPTVFQASKIQTLMGILQAVDARISIWLHKLLSQAARTTLIKHISQVIPLYQMDAFLIPKHLCRKMDSHLCKFWWVETLDPKDRKLHLLGRDILCSPKSEGGLGFRKAKLNNLAMLTRNVWRIIENPHCLLVIVLKARYFPRTDFLNAKCPNKCSWTWKCLHAIKELINPFITWIVGDGQFIDPWCDKWIPSLGSASPNPLVPPDPNIKVSYFINPITRSWDVNRLNTHFDDASVEKIVTIPLSQICTHDKRAWDLSKNGRFTSKVGLRGLRPSPCSALWKKPSPIISHNIFVGYYDKWMPPPTSWIKCNTDGAYDDISENNGAGYVMRDFSNIASFCGSIVFEVKFVEEAEARAIWAALKKAVEQKLTHIIIESEFRILSEVVVKTYPFVSPLYIAH
ncbi:uncharacterized protein LOC113312733 [Papaver somniferum]|uniref:uncharacterized protein LOC113312733 n=1 Tax=Papaver somniferum TaxID=3469 RepID=UPI000E6F8C15|nr:uncharacterized protein LOC113312733 [Papaver somniferum]